MTTEQRIKLTTAQARPIVKATFPNYQGRKFNLVFSEKVLFYDLNWSGGTCNKYSALRSDGLKIDLRAPAPWNNPYEGQSYDIPVDVLIVERSYFLGKDCGITIYSHPSNAPKLLPNP